MKDKPYIRATLSFFFFCLFVFSIEQSIAKPDKSIALTVARCAVCHGRDGNTPINKMWPKLAGQNTAYLLKSLNDFRCKEKKSRSSAMMRAAVTLLSEKEMLQIAHYYSALPGSIDAAQVDLVPLGQRLYRGGDAAKKIPACLACHGPAGLGNPIAGFPRLSGQHAAYVRMQLQAFRTGKRIDREHQMMSRIAARMSDADIEAVASYISGLYF
jgi:cytochrome c553